MILSGSAVHTKGLGSSLVSFRKRLMAAWRSTIERKTPRLRRRLVNLAKKPSTASSTSLSYSAFFHRAKIGLVRAGHRDRRALVEPQCRIGLVDRATMAVDC